MSRPLVSVIMPSYNTPKDILIEAINSIFSQTYNNLELVIVDDGSIESVEKILCENHINLSLIKILRNDDNAGIVYSLNRALEESSGEFIARMDSDDIAEIHRIEKQVDFMMKNPDISIISTYARTFGEYEGIYKSPIEDQDIKALMLWKNPIIHPTVMIRTNVLRDNEVIYSSRYASEDYDMWARMAFEKGLKFHVLPEVLLNYRIHKNQVTATKNDKLKNDEIKIIFNIFKVLGIVLTKKEIELYNKARNNEEISIREKKQLFFLLKKIQGYNLTGISKKYLSKLYIYQMIKIIVKC